MNELLQLAVSSGIEAVAGSFHPQESEHHRLQICNYYGAAYAATIDAVKNATDQGFDTILLAEDPPAGTLDVGLVLPSREYVQELVAHYTANESIVDLLQSLSMRQAEDVLTIASSYDEGITVQTVARVVSLLPPSQGLARLEDPDPWYIPAPKLKTITKQICEHFATPFIAGGVLLVGTPGAGKTQAASYIAHELDLQGYRVDLAGVLSHYQALSEQNLRRLLQEVNSMHAGVILLDELEKLFSVNHQNDLQARLLSQLLWWLQSKPAQIVCVATTNDISKLPAELVRAGRFDIKIESRKSKAHLQQVSKAYTEHHELRGYTVKTEQTPAEVIASVNARETKICR